jgi:predicted nicotinamide N-methyase
VVAAAAVPRAAAPTDLSTAPGSRMPGYEVKHEQVSVAGVADLQIRSLLDRQQFSDPLGHALRLGISSAAWPLFGLLWPSGRQLAARLALRPVDPAERILEIGCGLGLASLVGHRRGADITASDCHPLAAGFLRHNLRLNGLSRLPYRHGHWREAPALPTETASPSGLCVAGRFDLVIGSDLLYERDDRGTLAGFIAGHAQSCSEVWIVDPNRGNRSHFNRHMANHGFTRHEEVLAAPAAGAELAYSGRLMVYRRGGAFTA